MGDLLVQFLSLKDLHLHTGDGGPAAAGGLPLRTALWTVCIIDCFLTIKLKDIIFILFLKVMKAFSRTVNRLQISLKMTLLAEFLQNRYVKLKLMKDHHQVWLWVPVLKWDSRQAPPLHG